MSRLSHRIERLETSQGGVSVIGIAPAQWTARQREAAVEYLARRQGVVGSVTITAIGQGWPEITVAEIVHVGSFHEILDHVAKHGRRIGDRRPA